MVRLHLNVYSEGKSLSITLKKFQKFLKKVLTNHQIYAIINTTKGVLKDLPEKVLFHGVATPSPTSRVDESLPDADRKACRRKPIKKDWEFLKKLLTKRQTCAII